MKDSGIKKPFNVQMFFRRTALLVYDVVSIVLARLLSPDDYGLLGLIAVFTAVCQALINGGFTTALIPKKDATDDDYNTVFISNLGMSLFLYIVIFLCWREVMSGRSALPLVPKVSRIMTMSL